MQKGRKRRISILNFKGGVGKSTLVENLAYWLASHGYRVLVIDLDRQSNAGDMLLAGVERELSMRHVLMGQAQLVDVIRQARENLYVAPADADLDDAIEYLILHRKQGAMEMLARQLVDTDYDFVLIDHAGMLSPVMRAGLLASDEILVPMKLEPYAVSGLFDMFHKLQSVLVDHPVDNSGIIPFAVNLRLQMSRTYLGELREEFGELMSAPVRADVLIQKAQSVQMSVFEYVEKYSLVSRAALDIESLALDLIEEGAVV